MIFGVLDVEDENEWVRHTKFFEQQIFTIPISATFGTIVSVINYIISLQKTTFISFHPTSNKSEAILSKKPLYKTI